MKILFESKWKSFLSEITDRELEDLKPDFDPKKLSFDDIFQGKTRILLPEIFEKNVSFNDRLFLDKKEKQEDGTIVKKREEVVSSLPYYKVIIEKINSLESDYGRKGDVNRVLDEKKGLYKTSKKYKNGTNLYTFTNSLVGLVEKRDIAGIAKALEIQDPDDQVQGVQEFLYDLAKMQKRPEYEKWSWTQLQQAVKGLREEKTFFPDCVKTITKIKDDLHLFYNTIAAGDLTLRIIVSRHPTDVIRMSDHPGMGSCHSPASHEQRQGMGQYYKCAIQEARGHGFVAYVVQNKDLKKVDLESTQQSEIFRDSKRDIAGIVPVSRIRLRKIVADMKGGEKVAVFSPEDRIYGDQNYKGPLLKGVLKWANEVQQKTKEYLDANEENVSKFQMYSTWSDHGYGSSAEVEFLNKLGIQTTTDKISSRYDKEQTSKNSGNYNYQIAGNAIQQVIQQLKENNPYIEDISWSVQELENDGYDEVYKEFTEAEQIIVFSYIKYALDFESISESFDQKFGDFVNHEINIAGGYNRLSMSPPLKRIFDKLDAWSGDDSCEIEVSRNGYITLGIDTRTSTYEEYLHNANDVTHYLNSFPTKEQLDETLLEIAKELISEGYIEYSTPMDDIVSKDDDDVSTVFVYKDDSGNYNVLFSYNNEENGGYDSGISLAHASASNRESQERDEYIQKNPNPKDLLNIFLEECNKVRGTNFDIRDLDLLMRFSFTQTFIESSTFEEVLKKFKYYLESYLDNEDKKLFYLQNASKMSKQDFIQLKEIEKKKEFFQYYEQTNSQTSQFVKKLYASLRKVQDGSAAVIRQNLGNLWTELQFLPEMKVRISKKDIDLIFESDIFDEERTHNTLKAFVNILKQNKEKIQEMSLKIIHTISEKELNKLKQSNVLRESKRKPIKLVLRIR